MKYLKAFSIFGLFSILGFSILFVSSEYNTTSIGDCYDYKGNLMLNMQCEVKEEVWWSWFAPISLLVGGIIAIYFLFTEED